MVRKADVLKLVAARSREGRGTSYQTLARELPLSEDAACEHLSRLWLQRLIELLEPREEEYRRLLRHESVRNLQFAISERGTARLRFWKRKAETDEELWPW